MSLPLPWSGVCRVDAADSNPDAGFLAAAMYTANLAERARRFEEACRRWKVPFVLYELPEVHCSMSMRGTRDLAYTKANFIARMLEEHARPVLYLDVDSVVRAYPTLIDELAASRVAFAAYNWLADPENETYAPVEVVLDGKTERDRFYLVAHRVPLYAQSQLVPSGMTQLYGTAEEARELLQAWQDTIEKFPGTADDHCLSFAYNNGSPRISRMKVSWLPKAYARIPWWITTEPVIDHPDPLSTLDADYANIPETPDARRLYSERTLPMQARFPEPCLVDVHEGKLYHVDGEVLLPAGQAKETFKVQPGATPSLTLHLRRG